MYTAVIIDDEPNAIVSLKLVIQEYLNEKVKVVETATSVKGRKALITNIILG